MICFIYKRYKFITLTLDILFCGKWDMQVKSFCIQKFFDVSKLYEFP